MCGALGTKSDHADHIVPIEQGGARLDVRNGQRLCPTCHNSAKQAQDKRGYTIGCDENGVPLDPRMRARWAGDPHPHRGGVVNIDRSTAEDRHAGFARTFAIQTPEKSDGRRR